MLFYIIITIPPFRVAAKVPLFFDICKSYAKKNCKDRQIAAKFARCGSKLVLPKDLYLKIFSCTQTPSIQFLLRQGSLFSHIKDKSLDLQKLGLAKMKINNCNFCKSINTLKINKINSKNVKMSKCQLFSRA